MKPFEEWIKATRPDYSGIPDSVLDEVVRECAAMAETVDPLDVRGVVARLHKLLNTDSVRYGLHALQRVAWRISLDPVGFPGPRVSPAPRPLRRRVPLLEGSVGGRIGSRLGRVRIGDAPTARMIAVADARITSTHDWRKLPVGTLLMRRLASGRSPRIGNTRIVGVPRAETPASTITPPAEPVLS